MAPDNNTPGPANLDPSRYAAFDQDDDDNDLRAVLAPRSRTTNAPAEPADAGNNTTEEPSATPAPADVPASSDTPPAEPTKKQRKKKSATKPTPAREPDPEPEQPDGHDSDELDPHSPKQSMAHVDPTVSERVRQLHRETGEAVGKIITNAIETTYADGRLASKLAGDDDVPHSLFGNYRTRVPDRHKPVKVPLNFKRQVWEIQVMDRLVNELGAVSRSELIATALELYFQAEDDT